MLGSRYWVASYDERVEHSQALHTLCASCGMVRRAQLTLLPVPGVDELQIYENFRGEHVLSVVCQMNIRAELRDSLIPGSAQN